MTTPEEFEAVFKQLGGATKAIIAFENGEEFRALDAYYRRPSTLEILGIHRSETRHSRFLAWLLSPAPVGDHGLGAFGLKKFLEACTLAHLESRQRPPTLEGCEKRERIIELIDDLLLGDAVIEDVEVHAEYSIGKLGRLDLFVECEVVRRDQPEPETLWILIENKVHSKEGQEQTSRYAEWLDSRPDGEEPDQALLIYLTPLPSLQLQELEQPQCGCKDFLQINYQLLVDHLIEPARARANPTAGNLIGDYIRALTVPTTSMDPKGDRGDIAMAISDRERRLLAGFVEKHKTLLLAAFYAMETDPEQDDEQRDLAKKVIATLGTGKGYSRMDVLLDGEPVVTGVRKTNVGRELARVLIESGIDRTRFELLRRNKSSGFELLKVEADITQSERSPNRYRLGKQEPLEFGGESFLASANWGDNNLPKLITFLKANFPEIEIRKSKE